MDPIQDDSAADLKGLWSELGQRSHDEAARIALSRQILSSFTATSDAEQTFSRMVSDNAADLAKMLKDPSATVRLEAVTFSKAAALKSIEYVAEIQNVLALLLDDESVLVCREAVLLSIAVYRTVFFFLSRVGRSPSSERMWIFASGIRDRVLDRIGSPDEILFCHALKMAELVVVLHCKTITPMISEYGNLSLNNFSPSSSAIDVDKEWYFGRKTLSSLLSMFQPFVSVSILQTLVISLTTIARFRNEYISQITPALVQVYSDLPADLSKQLKTRIASTLKISLLTILKTKSATEWRKQVLSALFTITGKDYSSVAETSSSRQINIDSDGADVHLERKKRMHSLVSVAEPEQENPTSEKKASTPADTPTDIPRPSRALTAKEREHHDFVQTVINHIQAIPDNPPEFQRTPRIEQLLSAFREIANVESQKYVDRMSALDDKYAKPVISKRDTKRDPRLANEYVDPYLSQYPPDSIVAEETNSIVPISYDTQETSSVPYNYDYMDDYSSKNPDAKFQATEAQKVSSATDNYADISIQALSRIMDNEELMSSESHRKRWVETVCRLVARFPKSSQAWQRFKSFLLADIVARLDLAVSWLHHEYILSIKVEAEDSKARYEEIFEQILQRLPEDIHMLQFLLMVPCILPSGITKIRSLINPSKLEFGLSVYEKLIKYRAGMREQLLADLFDYSRSEDAQLKNESIALITNNLFNNAGLCDFIIRSAEERVQLLVSNTPPRDTEQSSASHELATATGAIKSETGEDMKVDYSAVEKGVSNASEDYIKQNLLLYLGLCRKRISLFIRFSEIFPGFPANVKTIIANECKDLVQSFSSNVDVFVDVIKNFAPEAENLVLCIVQAIADNGLMTTTISSAWKDVYVARGLDGQYLIPIIQYMTKDEFVQSLPRLLLMTKAACYTALDKLMEGACRAISPIDLVVNLHTIDTTKHKIHVKVVIEAIEYCFEKKQVYTQDVLERILFRLNGLNSIPELTMRTMIQAVKLYPRLLPTSIKILHELVKREVWKTDKLWKGFGRCCAEHQPSSFGVILTIPPPQLQVFFKQFPDVGQNFMKAINAGELRTDKITESKIREAFAFATSEPENPAS